MARKEREKNENMLLHRRRTEAYPNCLHLSFAICPKKDFHRIIVRLLSVLLLTLQYFLPFFAKTILAVMVNAIYKVYNRISICTGLFA